MAFQAGTRITEPMQPTEVLTVAGAPDKNGMLVGL